MGCAYRSDCGTRVGRLGFVGRPEFAGKRVVLEEGFTREDLDAATNAVGDPDLQGVWPGTDFVGVPLVRADSLGTRNELTDTEFTARLAAAQRQTEDDNAEFDINNVPPEVVARGTVGGPVSPPPHWLERASQVARASLIVDPPDGKLPPQAEAAQKRAAERQKARDTGGDQRIPTRTEACTTAASHGACSAPSFQSSTTTAMKSSRHRGSWRSATK